MLHLDTLGEGDIRRELSGVDLSLARQLEYRVRGRLRDGRLLQAQLAGPEPLRVVVEVGPQHIASTCGCVKGGGCVHVAAVLLAWLREPDSFPAQLGAIAPLSLSQPAAQVSESPAVDEQVLRLIPSPVRPTYQPKKKPAWLRSTLEGRRQAADELAREWLSNLRVQDLRNMASLRGWTLRGTTKAALLEQCFEGLAEPASIARAVERLDREQRQVLCALLLLGDNAVRATDLERVARGWGDLQGRPQAADYVYGLRAAGLTMPGLYSQSSWRQIDLVPPSVASALPPLLTDLLGGGLQHSWPLPESSRVCLADPFGFLRTLHQVALELESPAATLRAPMPRPQVESYLSGLQRWDYVPEEVLSLQQAGRSVSYADVIVTVPPRSRALCDEDVARLSPLAGGEARLEFIYSLLVSAGLIQPGSPVTPWQEVRLQFLRRDELAQRAVLARTYMHMGRWNEVWEWLRECPALAIKRRLSANLKSEQLAEHLLRLRQTVLRVFACLPDGVWIAWAEVERLLRLVWPRFDQTALQSFGVSGHWFLARAETGQPLNPESTEDWAMAQGGLARWIVCGPLHWLGFADLLLEGEKLAALRLHGWADLFWDRVEAPAAPPHAQALAADRQGPGVQVTGCSVSVQPSRVGVEAHDLLEKIARLRSVTAGGFLYELDAATTYASFEAGLALKDVLEGWPRLLGVPLPEEMRRQLEQWWGAYGSVRIYEGLTVIEFADDYALEEMKAVTSLSEHLVVELSPRLVIIEPSAAEQLAQELERAGYTPKLTDQV